MIRTSTFLIATVAGLALAVTPAASRQGAAAEPGASPPASPGRPAGRIVTPDLLLSDFASTLGSLAAKPPAPRWLADSRHVVFATQDAEGSWIERMDVETGRRERLFRGSAPLPSPDGKAIAFLQEEDGAEQAGAQKERAPRRIAIYTLADRAIRAVAPMPAGNMGFDQGFAWSPDARRIAYGFRPARVKKAAAVDPDAPSVWVMGAAGDAPPDSEIWVVDLASGASQRVATGAFKFANPGWLDDASFLFARLGSFEYRTDDVTGRIVAVSAPAGAAPSGEIRTLIDKAGVQDLRPAVSPDRRTIAFKYDPTNIVFPSYWNIAIAPAAGGPIRRLTSTVHVGGGPIWSGDGTRLYFTGKTGVYTQIYSVTTAGKLDQITAAPRSASNLAVSPSGKRMIWTTEDALGRADVRVANTDGGGERVLIDLAPKAKGLALGAVEELRWKSRDGLEIPGLLIKPLGYRPGTRYPLIVNLHGGPQGGVYMRGEILMSSPLEWHMWAAKGYAVFVPDYRSSTIPGWDPVLKAREAQDQNARDMDDVMSGVDAVIARGIADPDRLAVVGHSAGSQLTNWIITQTGRFKAAFSYEGWAENYFSYGSGQRVGGNSISEWAMKGKPWEVPENYLRNSPASFVKGVTTPTLFVSGDYGGKSGVENLYHHEFMFTALRKQGVDTELLIYRGENHVITRPANQRDLLTRAIRWIDARVLLEAAH